MASWLKSDLQSSAMSLGKTLEIYVHYTFVSKTAGASLQFRCKYLIRMRDPGNGSTDFPFSFVFTFLSDARQT